MDLWKELQDRLSSIEEAVAEEVLARAKEVFPSRRAKEAFRARAGRTASPLEEPLLRVATVLMEEKLVESYEEAFRLLGVEAEPSPVQVEPAPVLSAQEAPAPSQAPSPGQAPPPVEAPSPGQAGAPPPTSRAEKPPQAQDQNQAAQEGKWRRAYREVFGQDPSEDPLLYRERLAQALLLYRKEHGRRRAFQEVLEAERRLQESRSRTRELLGSEPQVDVGAAYVQLGKLAAQLEDLMRRVERLEEAAQKEASRFGGVNAALRLHHQEIRALKTLVEGLRAENGVDWKQVERVVRTAKAETIREVEERIQGATDLWRGEVEPRLKALEEWAKRITEAFRRTLEARERRKGLFGLFGGER